MFTKLILFIARKQIDNAYNQGYRKGYDMGNMDGFLRGRKDAFHEVDRAKKAEKTARMIKVKKTKRYNKKGN